MSRTTARAIPTNLILQHVARGAKLKIGDKQILHNTLKINKLPPPKKFNKNLAKPLEIRE